MKLQLPVYQFVIDDSQESGVKTISLVDDPAIQSFFVAFDNQKPKQKYFKSEYEQVVFGIALQPDFPIYRVDNNTGEEYYGIFSVDTIKKIVHKFHKELQSNNVNLMHNEQAYINAYMFSDFIVDSELQIEDLKAKGITDAKIGSWITAYKIEDPEIFNSVIEGSFRGFSVECYLDTIIMSNVKNNILNKKVNEKMKKNNKSIKERILSIFTELELLNRVLVPELAFEIEWTEIGSPVNKIIVDPNGNESLQPVGQGEFNTEEGIIVVDEQSNLVEIREMPMQPEVEVESPEVSASGSTSGSTSGNTETVVAAIIDDQTEPTPSGVTETAISGETAVVKAGIEKSILEIVGSNDGQYTVLVTVAGGIVTEATAQSMVDLMLAKQQEIDALKLSVETLEARMKEPIGEPILGGEPKVITPADFQKMSAYERSMHKKGLQAV